MGKAISQLSLGNAIAPTDYDEVSQLISGTRRSRRATAAMKRLYMRDAAVLLDYVQTGDADHSAAMTRALATGKPVLIPYNDGATYTFSQTFALAAGAVVFCDNGRAVINMTTTGSLFTATSVSNVRLFNLKIDSATLAAHTIVFDGCTDCLVYDVDTLRAGSSGIVIKNGCVRVIVERGSSNSCGQHGVVLDGSSTTDCVVTRRKFTSNTGFGVIVSGGVTDCEVSFNKTYTNGIELVGVTYECSRIRVIGNHAEGTGDNGISITGSGCLVVGNICRGNWHNGINLYGSRNVATGNVCNNNGQRFTSDATDWAGIHVCNGFGGAAYDNSVSGNVCCDDQASPTQGWGTHIAVTTYPSWVTATVTTVRTFKANGNNVYVSTSAGTTGATAPTHTSGTVNDGGGSGVDWLFLFGLHSDAGVKGPCNNHIGTNACFNNRIRDDRDESGNYNGYLAKVRSFGATPINVVSGYGGDVVIRYDANNPYVCVYVKSTGTTKDKTQWNPLQPRVVGATTARQSGASGLEGIQFWNTDKNRPEFNAGANLSAAWLDALGRSDPNNNVTAAGTTQTDATQLLYCDNAIQSASAGTGVKLPAITFAGQEMYVFNPSGGTPNIYPSSGHSIDALSTNAAFTTAAGGKYKFIAFSTTQWRSFKSA